MAVDQAFDAQLIVGFAVPGLAAFSPCFPPARGVREQIVSLRHHERDSERRFPCSGHPGNPWNGAPCPRCGKPEEACGKLVEGTHRVPRNGAQREQDQRGSDRCGNELLPLGGEFADNSTEQGP